MLSKLTYASLCLLLLWAPASSRRAVQQDETNDTRWGNKPANCKRSETTHPSSNTCPQYATSLEAQQVGGYLGCFVDENDNRKLGDEKMSSGATPQKCRAKCYGYKYFGLQFKGECHCGDARNGKGPKRDDSECNTACEAQRGVMCGGAHRNSIYHVLQAECEVCTQCEDNFENVKGGCVPVVTTVIGEWEITTSVKGTAANPHKEHYYHGVTKESESFSSEFDTQFESSLTSVSVQFCLFACAQFSKTEYEASYRETYKSQWEKSSETIVQSQDKNYFTEDGLNLYQFQWKVMSGKITLFTTKEDFIVQGNVTPECLPGKELKDPRYETSAYYTNCMPQLIKAKHYCQGTRKEMTNKFYNLRECALELQEDPDCSEYFDYSSNENKCSCSMKEEDDNCASSHGASAGYDVYKLHRKFDLSLWDKHGETIKKGAGLVFGIWKEYKSLDD